MNDIKNNLEFLFKSLNNGQTTAANDSYKIGFAVGKCFFSLSPIVWVRSGKIGVTNTYKQVKINASNKNESLEFMSKINTETETAKATKARLIDAIKNL